MRIVKIVIKNFRGIKDGEILFPNHGVLVGDNNTGKSTILEAIDLALGPERMKHRPVIDEHDFYAGDYLLADTNIEISSEVIISDLSDEQETYFKDNLEWWNKTTNTLLTEPPAEGTDAEHVSSALRVSLLVHMKQKKMILSVIHFTVHQLKTIQPLQSFQQKTKDSVDS